MTICVGKSCSFGLPRVPFVNCCQFMYLVISLLVLRAGCGIWLYQFLIIAYLFTLYEFSMTFLPVRGRIASGWKMSMYSFQWWACDDFGPAESGAWSERRPYLWVLQAPYCSARLVVGRSKLHTASVRRLHEPALHPKGHLTTLVGYTNGFMLYWA